MLYRMTKEHRSKCHRLSLALDNANSMLKNAFLPSTLKNAPTEC
jgi:hypothetical protein